MKLKPINKAKITSVILTLILTIFLVQACQMKAGVEEETPNFVIILIDDLGSKDVGCYGQKYIQTPNIDKLAEQGMRWTNAYSACPVCSPTRAALLTGKSTARVHFTGHITAIGRHRYPESGRIIPPDDLMYLPHSEILIPEAIKSLGYKSISIGKWHVGHKGYYPTDQGFDLNIGGWTHGSPPSHFYPYESQKEWNSSIPTLIGGKPGEYLTDRLTDEAIKFVEENREDPFLLYLTHYAVHTPLEAPEHLIKKYKPIVKSTKINPVYAAMVESVDSNIGRLLKRIEELGLDNNTVVIFASDNGALKSGSDNSPFREGKGYLYEGGIRVPFIMRWPERIASGVISENPTISQDIFSTIVDIAGVKDKIEHQIDGRSLVPDFSMVKNDDVDLFWYYPHYSPQSKMPGAAVRSGAYKLIKFYDPVKNELYNLETDIGETNDLSEKMPEKVKELAEKLEKWLVELNAIRHTQNPNFIDTEK